MKFRIKISDFLQTGQFGYVKLGDSKKEVIKLLGTPDGMINLSHPSKGIHYGKYEFIFVEDQLKLIQNDQFNIDHPKNMAFSNEFFQIDPVPFNRDDIQTLGNIETELKRLKISYSIIDYLDRKVIRTEGNIIIDFDDEKWSETINVFEKISNIKNYRLIGFRSNLDE